MCGVAGVLHFEAGRAADPRLVRDMAAVLAHRGPDGQGEHLDGGLGLGHRRLAIIDLSPEAAQPLANEDGSVWISFNGEIYNFRELRRELEAKGHRFRSRSDTEVIVHLYEECGAEAVDRLRGMFAFALWDARRRRLLLARDRFGQKPLYYRLTDRSLHFASEIKAILEDPGVERRPEPRWLLSYLGWGYVPAPHTAFAGIRKLPPAHRLTVDADGGHRLERYWRLRPGEATGAPTVRQRRAAEERVRELLDESTRLRMVSDVPLGAFLSGGIDSSAVVASMCAARGAGDSPVRTFSIGFREHGFDESGYAAEVARRLGTDHRALELDPEAFVDLERLAWQYGEPFADSSCLPTYALSKLARRHVTVALTGDGGDELFCGYRRYVTVQLESWLRTAPAVVRWAARWRGTAGLARLARRRALASDLERGRAFGDRSLTELYVSRLEALGPGLRAELCEDDLLACRADSSHADPVLEAIEQAEGRRPAERYAFADVATYLPDDILVKVDVASMAHGLECRAPLLDHVLAEYVAGLPFQLKLAGLVRKAVLKRAMRRRLPRRIVNRRKKGFSIPLDAWLRGGSESLLRDTLLSRQAVERGYFRRAAVERLIGRHAAGERNLQSALFCLLMLEMWHRVWIDGGSHGTARVPAAAGAAET